MSTPPPPPPPFAPASSATTRRWDRQAQRAQRRAAAAVSKQQRAIYRAQMQASRRRSLLGPIFLVTLGVVFLLLEAGTLQWGSTLGALARWWPLVLVAAGVVLLGEWALDTWLADGATPAPPRRTLGGGGVLLLVFIALAGATASLYNNSDWLPHTWDTPALESWKLNDLFAHHADSVRELSEPLAAGGTLEIRNYRGSITVTGDSQDGRVHVTAHQRLWARHRRDLRRVTQQNRPTLTPDGENLLLAVGGSGNDEANLSISVPHESGLRIGAEQGQIEVNELHGPLTIQDHRGDMALTALTGHILLTARDDGATITGHSITGDLRLDGRTGDLTFSDVTGPLTLRGDFFGTTQLERVKGPVTFQSSFTALACAGVPGTLTVEGRSKLQGDGLTGPVTLSTTDRSVNLEDLRGAATVTNQNGEVTLALTAPLGPVRITTTNSPIHLRIPEHAALQLNAATSNGEITTDLGLHPEQHGDRITLTGQVHTGGPMVQVQTTDGSIDIRTGSATAEADDTRL